MTIKRRTIIHDGPGGPFESMLAFDDAADGPRPGILLIPNVLGQKEWDNQKAEALAALGYVALATDIYGQGKRSTAESENPAQYMQALNADRGLLRDRLHASLATLKAQDEVEAARTAAIGFCFGGKCVIDMVRSGADILGAVSFHGLFDAPDYPIVTPVKARLLICHGWDDPIAQPDAAVGVAKELSDAGVDWQMHAYGHAGHGFTHKGTGPARPGFGYDEKADRRSWQAMQNFFAEIFDGRA